MNFFLKILLLTLLTVSAGAQPIFTNSHWRITTNTTGLQGGGAINTNFDLLFANTNTSVRVGTNGLLTYPTNFFGTNHVLRGLLAGSNVSSISTNVWTGDVTINVSNSGGSGTMAYQNSNAVKITGGGITNVSFGGVISNNAALVGVNIFSNNINLLGTNGDLNNFGLTVNTKGGVLSGANSLGVSDGAAGTGLFRGFGLATLSGDKNYFFWTSNGVQNSSLYFSTINSNGTLLDSPLIISVSGDILRNGSGTGNIGSAATPHSNIYSVNISGFSTLIGTNANFFNAAMTGIVTNNATNVGGTFTNVPTLSVTNINFLGTGTSNSGYALSLTNVGNGSRVVAVPFPAGGGGTGTMSYQDSNAVNITGGRFSGSMTNGAATVFTNSVPIVIRALEAGSEFSIYTLSNSAIGTYLALYHTNQSRGIGLASSTIYPIGTQSGIGTSLFPFTTLYANGGTLSNISLSGGLIVNGTAVTNLGNFVSGSGAGGLGISNNILTNGIILHSLTNALGNNRVALQPLVYLTNATYGGYSIQDTNILSGVTMINSTNTNTVVQGVMTGTNGANLTNFANIQATNQALLTKTVTTNLAATDSALDINLISGSTNGFNLNIAGTNKITVNSSGGLFVRNGLADTVKSAWLAMGVTNKGFMPTTSDANGIYVLIGGTKSHSFENTGLLDVISTGGFIFVNSTTDPYAGGYAGVRALTGGIPVVQIGNSLGTAGGMQTWFMTNTVPITNMSPYASSSLTAASVLTNTTRRSLIRFDVRDASAAGNITVTTTNGATVTVHIFSAPNTNTFTVRVGGTNTYGFQTNGSGATTANITIEPE